ncbi:MAG: TrbC/VirB2 family protein [Rickettsiaceae bacterium]|nr:TrbC/VirB2 family protein [Rickettsiaceae bacterium]
MNLEKLNIEVNSDLIWRVFLMITSIFAVLMVSDVALAGAGDTDPANNDVVGETLCRLVANLSGGIARGIATIAIFAVGVGLFLGKLNWGIAAATAAGVGIIFSAPRLVAFLSGDADNANCPVNQ